MGKEEREKEKMESFRDRVLMCKSVKTHLHVEEHNIEKKQNLEVKHSILYLRSIKSKCTRSSMPNFFNVSTWGVIVQGVCLKERLWIPYMCEY